MLEPVKVLKFLKREKYFYSAWQYKQLWVHTDLGSLFPAVLKAWTERRISLRIWLLVFTECKWTHRCILLNSVCSWFCVVEELYSMWVLAGCTSAGKHTGAMQDVTRLQISRWRSDGCENVLRMMGGEKRNWWLAAPIQPPHCINCQVYCNVISPRAQHTVTWVHSVFSALSCMLYRSAHGCHLGNNSICSALKLISFLLSFGNM